MKTVINKLGLLHHIKKKGLSIGSFCEQVGITRMSLNKYIRMVTYPTVDVELRMCRAAGIPRRWLYMSEKRYMTFTNEQLTKCKY